MTIPLLVGVTGIYLWVAYTYLQQDRWGMAGVFAAYAVANLGFIWDVWEKGGR